MQSLEKKWIENKINLETYNRWHSDYTRQRNLARAQIDKLNKDYSLTNGLMRETISELTDMKALYLQAKTSGKQDLIQTVFYNSLYYENKIYRTPYIIPELGHNELIMREKRLLDIIKKGENFSIPPSGGGEGNRTPVQT